MKRLFVLLLVCCLCTSAFGEAWGIWFQGRDANDPTDWGRLGNWWDYTIGGPAPALPTATQQVMFQASPVTVKSGYTALSSFMSISSVTITIESGGKAIWGNTDRFAIAAAGVLNVNEGAELIANRTIIVAEGDGVTSVMNVDGDVNCPGGLDICVGNGGHGTVNVGPTGSIVMDSLSRLTVGGRASGNYTAALIIDVGGSVYAGDNWGGLLQSAIDTGKIRATPGNQLVVTWHTDPNLGPVNGGATFTAMVPTEIKAFTPSPSNTATGVVQAPTLTWGAPAGVTSHNVFFGTSFEAVDAATVPTANVTAQEFAPGTLSFERTYYWRVDEVVDGDPSSPYKGDVWSFSTATADCDYTGDNIVDMSDLALFVNHWLQSN